MNDKLGVQGGLIQEFGEKLGNCTERIETFKEETRSNTKSVTKLTRKQSKVRLYRKVSKTST